MSNSRQYSFFDRLLIKFDRGFQSLANTISPHSNRESPAQNLFEPPLSLDEKKKSARLMRVNHTGEVCAQALYLGQSLTARDEEIANKLKSAAKEEIDHLKWCEIRLNELNSHQSYLNPLWFAGSFAIGSLAGLVGDKWSLGFLAETEEQVYRHLNTHLEKLPEQDNKSRAILITMREEEQQHATHAHRLGAAKLPYPIKITMRATAKIMTGLAYYF